MPVALASSPSQTQNEEQQFARTLIDNLADTLDPEVYLRHVGFGPYDWQSAGLDPSIRRLILLCARQAGKSVLAAGRTAPKAKHLPRSLHIIVSASEDQAVETMHKVEDIYRDDPSVRLVKDSATEKELDNGSRIVVLPATEKAVASYSGPKTIVVDEAAWVLDGVFGRLTPMLTGNPDAELILLSTPHGKRGFFWRIWQSQGTVWRKIFVRPAFDLVEGEFVPAAPEEEFRAHWAQRGVQAFYSPRHTLEFLQEMAEIHPALEIRQEYLCEFVEMIESVFSDRDIEAMFRSEDDVLDTAGPSIFSDKGSLLMGR